MQEHVCKRLDFCTCWPLALEPDEDCPIHGHGPLPPRCCICGRFMKWDDPLEKALFGMERQYKKRGMTK